MLKFPCDMYASLWYICIIKAPVVLNVLYNVLAGKQKYIFSYEKLINDHALSLSLSLTLLQDLLHFYLIIYFPPNFKTKQAAYCLVIAPLTIGDL